LFDRTPQAWSRIGPWSRRKDEFQKRAAFALLWGLSVHDKSADDAKFLDGLQKIEQAAGDERHYVKKAVNMSLRAIGKRNAVLRAAAIRVAERLSKSESDSARWIGRDALRELSGKRVDGGRPKRR
jgi:3-methyladenine DNA glycosylase AlkD